MELILLQIIIDIVYAMNSTQHLVQYVYFAWLHIAVTLGIIRARVWNKLF